MQVIQIVSRIVDQPMGCSRKVHGNIGIPVESGDEGLTGRHPQRSGLIGLSKPVLHGRCGIQNLEADLGMCFHIGQQVLVQIPVPVAQLLIAVLPEGQRIQTQIDIGDPVAGRKCCV